jgi:hypothetical protein
MEHIPVISSNLRSVGYDPDSLTLEIKFRSGRLYQYYNVPVVIYEGLMSAGSHGEYHHQNIKWNYSYRRIG